MPNPRPLLRVALAASASLGVARPALACGGAVECACGDIVTEDYTLPRDLPCPSATVGLRVTAGSDANVEIDGAGFALRMGAADAVGVRINNADGAYVHDLTVVSTGGGDSRGVEVSSSSDVVIEDNVLDGLGEGVWAGGGANSDPRLAIRGNDLGNSTLRGLTLVGATNTLVLEGNVFGGSEEAILLRDFTGPWTLDAADGNDFTDVSRNDDEQDVVIALQAVTGVTLDGLDLSTDPSFPLSYHDGVGVRILGSTNVTVSNSDLSGRYRGLDTAASGPLLNGTTTFSNLDVSDADHFGMILADWGDAPTLSNVVFDDCDNGLRLVALDFATPSRIDLGTCSFENIGETYDQAALRVVRSDNVVIDRFAASVIARGTGIEVQDSTNTELRRVRVCGEGRLGVDLTTSVLGTGSDDTLFGTAGNVFLENEATGNASNPSANVRISLQSDFTDLGGTIVAGEPTTTVSDASLTTIGSVTPFGTAGWAYDDADVDTCNDLCDDGDDTDGDGVCDDGDFGAAVTVLAPGSVPWVPAGSGVGSPTVVFDTLANRWLMIFEVQTGPVTADCEHGSWSLGLATSANGIAWTAAGSPILSPTAGTPYACVAAQPTVVNNSGVNTIWFKAEDETGYRGVGRMVATWGGSSFGITAPDPSVVLSEQLTFGYLHAVFDTTLSGLGGYRFLLARYPSIYATSGGNTTPLAALTGPILGPTFAPWSSDEAFNPAIACGRGGTGWTMFAGGRDTTPATSGYTIDGQSLGRLESSDFTTWSRVAGSAALSMASGNAEHRHWDVLPIGAGQYVVFYDDQGATGGVNRIRAEVTGGLAWTAGVAAQAGDKICTP